MHEREFLLQNIHKALLGAKYINPINEHNSALVNAIEETILPVIDNFFEENNVNSKKIFWDENI